MEQRDKTYHRSRYEWTQVRFIQRGLSGAPNGLGLFYRSILVSKDSGILSVQCCCISTDVWHSTDPVIVVGLVSIELLTSIT